MPRKPFPAFAAELLGLYAPPLRSPRTLGKMRQVLAEVGRLGVAAASDLTPATVARFLLARPPGESPETTFGLLSYLRAACSYAVAMRYLPASPFAFRKLSQWVRRGEGASIPEAELARARHHGREAIAKVLGLLAAEAGTWEGARLQALACTVAYTGVRRDEALRSRVRDFDLPGRIFSVRGNGRRLKTGRSAAPVPIPVALAEVLAGWLPRAGESGWAFPGVKARGPWTGGRADRTALAHLKRAGDRAGVPGLTFQSLRHSWATHAEHWGLGELLVQRVLRHSTPRTQRHYRHADLANLSSAVASIDFRA